MKTSRSDDCALTPTHSHLPLSWCHLLCPTGMLHGNPPRPRQDLHHLDAVPEVAPDFGAALVGPGRWKAQRRRNRRARVKEEEGEVG